MGVESVESNVTKSQVYSRNIIAYLIINGILFTLLLLGGWGEYKFFANLFVGLTLVLSVIILCVCLVIPNKQFAKGVKNDWYSLAPPLIGLIAFGFGWWFSGCIWWIMSGIVFIKKLDGAQQLANEKRREEGSVVRDPVKTAGQVYDEVMNQRLNEDLQ